MNSKNVGDMVKSLVVPSMTGKIKTINSDGTGLVDVNGSVILTHLDNWVTADGR